MCRTTPGHRDPRTTRRYDHSRGSLGRLRYALSEETRLKGAQELTKIGLINLGRRAVPMDAFEYRRGRNTHQIQRQTLIELQPDQVHPKNFETFVRAAKQLRGSPGLNPGRGGLVFVDGLHSTRSSRDDRFAR